MKLILSDKPLKLPEAEGKPGIRMLDQNARPLCDPG